MVWLLGVHGWKFGSQTMQAGDAIRVCLMRHKANGSADYRGKHGHYAQAAIYGIIHTSLERV